MDGGEEPAGEADGGREHEPAVVRAQPAKRVEPLDAQEAARARGERVRR